MRAAIIFIVFFTVYSYFIHGLGWNEHSRFDLIMAMVEEKRLEIDTWQENTGDKSFYNGHYYSDKPIGTSILGYPIYWGVKKLESFAKYQEKYPAYIVSVFVVALPSALLAVLLYQFLGYMGAGEGYRLLLTSFFGFGTLASFYSTLLFGHQTASFFAFVAFFIAYLVVRRNHSHWWLALAGLSAGMALITEYPIAIIIGLVSLYLLLMLRQRRWIMLFLIAAIPPLLVHIAYNYAAFDSPFKLPYSYVVDNPMFAGAKAGLFGITEPSWTALEAILVGKKGLLTNSPMLLLIPIGFWQMARQKGVRPEWGLCLAIVAAFLLYNMSYYDPMGGSTPGPRFLVPALPYAFIPLAFLASWQRVPLFILAIPSIAAMAAITLVGPHAASSVQSPIPEGAVPRLLVGNLTNTIGAYRFGLDGYAQLLPLVLFLALGLLLWALAPMAESSSRGIRALMRPLRPAILGTLIIGYLAIGFPLDWRQAGDLPRALAAQRPPEFRQISASVQPQRATSGQEVTINAIVTAGEKRVVNILVDLEIYDPGGSKVHQVWEPQVKIGPYQTRSFSFVWAVPPGALAGDYKVLFEVKSYDWKETYVIQEIGPLQIVNADNLVPTVGYGSKQ